ncbi:histidine phosphatase family protein [Deinococcus rubellus]
MRRQRNAIPHALSATSSPLLLLTAASHRPKIRARALTALRDLCAMPVSNILVVSHGGFLNPVLRELTGNGRAWSKFGDTGFTCLRLSREGHTVGVLGVQGQPHLA